MREVRRSRARGQARRRHAEDRRGQGGDAGERQRGPTELRQTGNHRTASWCVFICKI